MGYILCLYLTVAMVELSYQLPNYGDYRFTNQATFCPGESAKPQISCEGVGFTIGIGVATRGNMTDLLRLGETCGVNNTAHLNTEHEIKDNLPDYLKCNGNPSCTTINSPGSTSNPASYYNLYYDCINSNQTATMCLSSNVNKKEVMITNVILQVHPTLHTTCSCSISLTPNLTQLLIFTYDAELGRTQGGPLSPLTLSRDTGTDFRTWAPLESYQINLPDQNMTLLWNNTELKNYKFRIKLIANNPAGKVTVQCTEGEKPTTSSSSTSTTTTPTTTKPIPTTTSPAAKPAITSENILNSTSTIIASGTFAHVISNNGTSFSNSSQNTNSSYHEITDTNAPNPKSDASTSAENNGGLSIELIVGIVICVLVLIAIIIIGGFCYWKHSQGQGQIHPEQNNTPNSNNAANIPEQRQEHVEETETTFPTSANMPFSRDITSLFKEQISTGGPSNMSYRTENSNSQQMNAHILSDNANEALYLNCPPIFPPESTQPSSNTTRIIGAETNTVEQTNNDKGIENEENEDIEEAKRRKREKRERKRKKKERKRKERETRESGLNEENVNVVTAGGSDGFDADYEGLLS